MSVKYALTSLPDVVLENILRYLPYDDIAKNRIVCKHFNRICKQILNKGFLSVERHHSQCLKMVKSQLPRRESERRIHPLARHCDILTAVETRLSMLSMTFDKYIHMQLCCFIPGKVIDEIYRILRQVQEAKLSQKTHEVLQELRDISSMAMEHFDEKVAPSYKGALGVQRNARILTYHQTIVEMSHKLKSKVKQNKTEISTLKKYIEELEIRMKRQQNLSHRKMFRLFMRLSEQNTEMNDLKKQLVEYENKFADLSTRLSRVETTAAALAPAAGEPRTPSPAKRKYIEIAEEEPPSSSSSKRPARMYII